MNLVIIGNDVDDIAKEIWTANTNYTIINKNPDMWNHEFLKFIEERPVIVATTSEQFIEKNINDVLDFFISNEFTPILVADSNNTIEHNMYMAMEDDIPDVILYTKNEKNEDYNEFIKMTQRFLLSKGKTYDNNKIIRTSRKRKTKTTTK